MIIISDSKIEQLQHSQTLKLNVSSFLSLVVISFIYRHPLASQHYIYTCNSLFVNYCECHINVNGASVSEWAPLAVRVRVHLLGPSQTTQSSNPFGIGSISSATGYRLQLPTILLLLVVASNSNSCGVKMLYYNFTKSN